MGSWGRRKGAEQRSMWGTSPSSPRASGRVSAGTELAGTSQSHWQLAATSDNETLSTARLSGTHTGVWIPFAPQGELWEWKREAGWILICLSHPLGVRNGALFLAKPFPLSLQNFLADFRQADSCVFFKPLQEEISLVISYQSEVAVTYHVCPLWRIWATEIKEEMKQAEGREMREYRLQFPMWLWLLKLPNLAAASVSPSVKQESSYPSILTKHFELIRYKIQDTIRLLQACQCKIQIVGTTSAARYVTGHIPALHIYDHGGCCLKWSKKFLIKKYCYR